MVLAAVMAWIRRAELTAVNVGNGVRRPRYRVSQENFELFLKSREVPSPPPRMPRQRRIPNGWPLDPELGEQLLKKNQAVKVLGKYYRVHDKMILFF